MNGNTLTGVSLEIQNYLANIQENQQLISGTYVKDKMNPNFVEMVKHLYPGEEERFQNLVSGSYIGGLIDDKISSYFGAPEDDLDYRIDYDKLIETLLTTGYLMLKVSYENKKFVLSSFDGHKYYDDGVTEMFVEQYKVQEKNPFDNSILETKKYLYVQTFSGGILKNKLYEISSSVLSSGKEVSLDRIPELAGRPDEQIVTDFSKMVFKIKLETSLIEKVKTIIYSIERKWAEADKQFMNYMDQWTILKNIEIPKDAMKTVSYGGIEYSVTDFSKLGKILEIDADNGDGSVEIVKNGNDLIKEALEFSERQIRQISAITDVPTIFLGLQNENQGNDSGTSIVKSSGSFYKRIERYRIGFENLLWDIKEALNIEIKLTWNSIVTTDPEVIVDNEIKKLDAGLSTRKMSLMRIYNLTDEEATKMLQEIEAEKSLQISNNQE
ncbi:MAG TPA: hypothetical protein PKC87_00735 [Candidatus Absconditabacterales bacterium]|nr:hypothetical protein [Candidatus Absconditabacterales bacterium]